jgi:hypothetical protein
MAARGIRKPTLLLLIPMRTAPTSAIAAAPRQARCEMVVLRAAPMLGQADDGSASPQGRGP